MPGTHPIVTLTSDFGTQDHYVAMMKARLLEHCPGVVMVDITHAIGPQDILAGSIMLERAIDGFLPGTIHLAVVDPGVGTSRRILVVQIHQQMVVCPDNGLITWAWRRLGPGQAHELVWRPQVSSFTFHGRDIMAPAAGMLAAGERLEHLSRSIADSVLLDIAPATPDSETATIIHIDVFGNATTNMDAATVKQYGGCEFRLPNGLNVGTLRQSYGGVAPGEPLALIGSSGLLEIAVRNGSAAARLGLKVGNIVRLFR